RLAARRLRRAGAVRGVARDGRAAVAGLARRGRSGARGRAAGVGRGAAGAGARARRRGRPRARGRRGARRLRLLPRPRQPRGKRALDARRRAGRLAVAPPLALGRRSLAVVAAIGLCDVSANVLFALASGHGLLALVSVLGSLYPVMTVVLAHVLLGERLTPTQVGGVALALTGVAVLSSG